MQFIPAFLLNPSDDVDDKDQMRYGDPISFVSDTPCDASAGRISDYHWPDMVRVRSWIQSCNDVHHDKCFELTAQSSQRELPSLLRVFDVDRHCLIEIVWNEKYVTPSYVWVMHSAAAAKGCFGGLHASECFQHLDSYFPGYNMGCYYACCKASVEIFLVRLFMSDSG